MLCVVTPRVVSGKRDGLVSRTAFDEAPPRVQYALIPIGRSLRPLVVSLCHWAIDNVGAVLAARDRHNSPERAA